MRDEAWPVGRLYVSFTRSAGRPGGEASVTPLQRGSRVLGTEAPGQRGGRLLPRLSVDSDGAGTGPCRGQGGRKPSEDRSARSPWGPRQPPGPAPVQRGRCRSPGFRTACRAPAAVERHDHSQGQVGERAERADGQEEGGGVRQSRAQRGLGAAFPGSGPRAGRVTGGGARSSARVCAAGPFPPCRQSLEERGDCGHTCSLASSHTRENALSPSGAGDAEAQGPPGPCLDPRGAGSKLRPSPRTPCPSPVPFVSSWTEI